MEALSHKAIQSDMALQLLLFVDRRPSSTEQIRQIRQYLGTLETVHPFELETVDVSEQPYLAEHFKLVATPALIKIYPEPRQVLAGSNIPAQLERWWPRWQKALEEQVRVTEQAESITKQASTNSIAKSAELIELSDEIFRLKQEREELRAQLQFKDRILAMLAHDLRNPLTAASLAVETLLLSHSVKEGWNARLSPAMTAQLLKHAYTQTRTIDRMVTDILQAAQGACAEFQIRPIELDLRQLCYEVIAELEHKVEARGQILSTDIPEDLPHIHADSERVRQVIVNLIDNAIKYTPEQGEIQIAALHRTNQKVQISICDTGPGIPEENKERIFEDSFRLKRDEAKDGYGIGLSLCQRVIRAHYGQIWVDSVPNQGSCFHFTLPVYRD